MEDLRSRRFQRFIVPLSEQVANSESISCGSWIEGDRVLVGKVRSTLSWSLEHEWIGNMSEMGPACEWTVLRGWMSEMSSMFQKTNELSEYTTARVSSVWSKAQYLASRVMSKSNKQCLKVRNKKKRRTRTDVFLIKLWFRHYSFRRHVLYANEFYSPICAGNGYPSGWGIHTKGITNLKTTPHQQRSLDKTYTIEGVQLTRRSVFFSTVKVPFCLFSLYNTPRLLKAKIKDDFPDPMVWKMDEVNKEKQGWKECVLWCLQSLSLSH